MAQFQTNSSPVMRSAHARHAFAALDKLIDQHYLMRVVEKKETKENE